MRTLLAVSGGIDSMCMAEMFSRAGEDFAVAHCNFHLRGSDSDGDALFVEDWARKRNVQFFRADFDTAAYASEHGVSIEMAARELRYSWFFSVARENGFDAVAVAHNANDNAETLILNLLRGTGSRGLRGMASEGIPAGCSALQTRATLGNVRGRGPAQLGGVERSETVCRALTPCRNDIRLTRPLLGMSRKEIEEYAAKNGVEYREDRTNKENEYKRNRIRNAVFPEFEKINPSFVRTLNEDMERFAQVDDIAEDYYREAAEKVFDGHSIDVTALLAHKHWKYVLYRILEPFGINEDSLDGLVALLEDNNRTFSGKRYFTPDYIIETTAGKIIIDRKAESPVADGMMVTEPGAYGFDGLKILVEKVEINDGTPLKQPAGVLLCEAEALKFPFAIRHWKEGDWMRPFGMEGRAKKVSDIFTDLKYSLSQKEKAAIVVSPALAEGDSSHIAAIAGVRMDEALRIPKGSTEAIRISIL